MQERLFYYVPDSTGWMERVAKAWGSMHLKGGTYFGKKESTVYSPYVKWIEERNKDRHWPFSLKVPLYLKEPDQPDVVPKGSYDQILTQNLRLLTKNEELGVKTSCGQSRENSIVSQGQKGSKRNEQGCESEEETKV